MEIKEFFTLSQAQAKIEQLESLPGARRVFYCIQKDIFSGKFLVTDMDAEN
jgi:hypothetical protein